jgi:hypothetical protein
MSPIHLLNGKQIMYAVPHGEIIGFDTQYYTEFLLDVDDLGNGKLDFNDINSEALVSTRDPAATLILGNYIGANRSDLQKYGRPLRPVIFTSPSDKNGDFSLALAIQQNGLDEPAVLGIAYALHMQKSGAFLGLDKEGHYYVNLPASKANPMGAGRSMSMLGQGSLKEVWGLDVNDANSWDLTTKGGIKWDVGKHNGSNKSRSIDIRTDSGVYLEINGEDDDGLSKSEVISGNTNEQVGGTKTVSANAYDLNIHGLKTENVEGASSEVYQNDLTMNVGGVFTETVISEKQSKIGKRKTTVTSGNDELTILRGDLTDTIQLFGKRSTTVTSGSIESSILVGDHKVSVGTGNYSVSVTAGSVEVKNNLGSVTVGIAGTVGIKGTLSVTVEAPIVKIGNNAPFGGALTGLPGIPSDYCRISGTPYKGSTSVGIA